MTKKSSQKLQVSKRCLTQKEREREENLVAFDIISFPIWMIISLIALIIDKYLLFVIFWLNPIVTISATMVFVEKRIFFNLSLKEKFGIVGIPLFLSLVISIVTSIIDREMIFLIFYLTSAITFTLCWYFGVHLKRMDIDH